MSAHPKAGSEPAYPQKVRVPNQLPFYAEGLTKRELFAAMAMQGFLSNQNGMNAASADRLYEASVYTADALIAELEKTNGQ